MHEHSLPVGDRDDFDKFDNEWTSHAIAEDIMQWNTECADPTQRIDINDPVHPEMAQSQKQDVIYHLKRMQSVKEQQMQEQPSTIPAYWDGWSDQQKEEWKRKKSLLTAAMERKLCVSPTACWSVAELNGWHTPPNTIAEHLLGIHEEVTEAAQAARMGNTEHMAEELADIVLRTFHAAECVGIDILKAMELKHEKNQHRLNRHGGKIF